MAPFGDILSALENARQAAWAERSPMNPAGGSGSSGSGSGSGVSGIVTQRRHGHRGSSSHGGGLPNSHSQPIYVPGKYSVCMFFLIQTTTTTTIAYYKTFFNTHTQTLSLFLCTIHPTSPPHTHTLHTNEMLGNWHRESKMA